MSSIKVHLRVAGDLTGAESVVETLKGMSAKVRRRGEVSGRRVQPEDVILLELAAWQSAGTWPDERALEQASAKAGRERLSSAAATLQQLAPVLSALDRLRCRAELYISTIREEDQGGFGMPAELIESAAAGKLSVEVSILVMLDDYHLPNKVGDA